MRSIYAFLAGLVISAILVAVTDSFSRPASEPASTQPTIDSAKTESNSSDVPEFSRAMPMGDHMAMAETRSPRPGDWDRADALAAATRRFVQKYLDYRVAEKAGYLPFMPEQKQPMYHFNRVKGIGTGSEPDSPASIIYEKSGPEGAKPTYRLVAVMYIAPPNATAAELDRIAPLSIAHWHMHINVCWPPAGRRGNWLTEDKDFGFTGSIATASACKAAGGRLRLRLLGTSTYSRCTVNEPRCGMRG